MLFKRNPWQEVLAGLGEPPRFLKLLLLSLSVGCLADVVEPLRPWVDCLRLDPATWERGEVWRVVTYGLFGRGGISAWVVVQLVLVYWLAQATSAASSASWQRRRGVGPLYPAADAGDRGDRITTDVGDAESPYW